MFTSLAPLYGAAQTETIIRGGTLVTPLVSDAHHLNPLTWGTTYEAYVLGHIYDPLVRLDVNNQFQPGLAHTWSVDATDEVWTFKLVENATWHDGEAVTTADVEFTHQMLIDNTDIPRRSWLHNNIDSITVVDDYEIKFDFSYGVKAADVLAEIGTLWVVPEHIWKDIADIASYANDDPLPVGSGPFTIEEWAHGQFFRLESYDDYYVEGKPYIDEKILQIVYEVEAGYYALSAGDLEVLGAPPPALEQVARADPNIDIWEGVIDYFAYIAPNQRRYPNNVKEFRQAVMIAINKSEIVEVARYGRGIVCPASCSMPVGPYYEPDIAQYEYNIATANSMLDALGWDAGTDGIRVTTNGTRLSFEMNCVSTSPEVMATAYMVKDMMEQIGVEITVRPMIWDNLWTKIGGDGWGTHDFDWVMAGWVEFWSDWHPEWAHWLFNGDNWWGKDYVNETDRGVNIPGWSGTQRDLVTNLTRDVLYETDEATIVDLLSDVQKIVAEELPYLPLVYLGAVTLYRNDTFTGWITGERTGPDNWQTWFNIHLIRAPAATPGFELISVLSAVIIILGIFALSRKRRHTK
jgi:peptide/nickel transport system substrate-binding protein